MAQWLAPSLGKTLFSLEFSWVCYLIFRFTSHLRVSTHPNLDFFYCIQYHRGSDLASGYFIFESTMKIAIATNQPGSPKKKISTP